MTFAERLRKTREATGLSQTEFGLKIGENQSKIKDLETGNTKKPSADMVLTIQNIFKVSGLWLVFGEGEMFVSDISLNREPPCPSYAESEEERDMIDSYRRLPENIKKGHYHAIKSDAFRYTDIQEGGTLLKRLNAKDGCTG